MSRAVVVGIFSLIGLVIAAWFVLRIQHVRLGRMPGIEYTVLMQDAEGLQEKAWVLFKGLRVGRVSDFTLDGETVAVRVTMHERIPLRQGAYAQVVNVGLLGEKQLELVQGPNGAPLLPDGAVIPAKPGPSIDRLIGVASELSEDVEAITDTVRGAVGGAEDQAEADEPLPGESVGGSGTEPSPADTQLEALMRDLRRAVTGIQRTSEAVTELVHSLSALTERQAPAIERTSESLSDTAENLETFTARIASPETGEKLDETLDAVKSGAEAIARVGGNARGLSLGASIRGDYLATRDRGKGYFGVTLAPEGPWFVELQAVSVPLATSGDHLRWTALAGYRRELYRLRLGVIESRPGLGADLLLFSDRLRLSADVWDVSRAGLLPHARVQATFFPIRPFFLVGGWDDALNVGRDVDSAFFGGGMEFGP